MRAYMAQYPFVLRLIGGRAAGTGPRYWSGHMSLHRSLKGSTKIRVKRNVLKRYERIDYLKHERRWQEGESPLGLPKCPSSE